jgi:hypothetical protein
MSSSKRSSTTWPCCDAGHGLSSTRSAGCCGQKRPRLDSDGAAVDVELLKAQLYRPNPIEREPRCGDTFAAPRGGDQHWRDGSTEDLRDLLGDSDVYDISADAREAAKIAYQSSLGAIQPAQAADESAQRAVERTLGQRAEEQLQPLQLSPPPQVAEQMSVQ